VEELAITKYIARQPSDREYCLCVTRERQLVILVVVGENCYRPVKDMQL
jgi:hypothetical protein